MQLAKRGKNEREHPVHFNLEIVAETKPGISTRLEIMSLLILSSIKIWGHLCTEIVPNSEI